MYTLRVQLGYEQGGRLAPLPFNRNPLRTMPVQSKLKTVALSCDFGNYSCQVHSPTRPGSVAVRRSCLVVDNWADLTEDFGPLGVHPFRLVSTDSQADFVKALVGETVIVGYASNPGSTFTLDQGKSDMALPLLLASLTPSKAKRVNLELRVSMTDPASELPLYQSALMGSHLYEHREGQTVVNITKVQAVQEGQPVYEHYRDQREEMGQPVAGSVGIVNIGGGTCDGLFFNEAGRLERSLRFNRIGGGTVALANLIANDLRQKGLVHETPSTQLILDGLASGEYTYGTFNKVDFSDQVERLLPGWFDGIMKAITTSWGANLNRLEQVVLCGGVMNHPYIQETVDSREGFSVTTDPTTDNVRHM